MSHLFHRTMLALESNLNCGLIASDLDLDNGLLSLSTEDSQLIIYAVQEHYSQVPLFDPAQTGTKRVSHVALIVRVVKSEKLP
jgi:hypothetical protein